MGISVDFKNISGYLQMLGGFTLLRMSGMLTMVNIRFTKEELLSINAKLNKIKLPRK